jgi:hypothetical protein
MERLTNFLLPVYRNHTNLDFGYLQVYEQNRFVNMFLITPSEIPKLNIHRYYSLEDLFSEIGGWMSIVQFFLVFFLTNFIYNEYSKFMAKRIMQRNPQLFISRNYKEVKEEFASRLSQESQYLVHSHIQSLT